MKRFLVFYGERHTQRYGAYSLLNDFDTLEGAIAAVMVEEMNNPDVKEKGAFCYTWAHVWDSELRKVVWDTEEGDE